MVTSSSPFPPSCRLQSLWLWGCAASLFAVPLHVAPVPQGCAAYASHRIQRATYESLLTGVWQAWPNVLLSGRRVAVYVVAYSSSTYSVLQFLIPAWLMISDAEDMYSASDGENSKYLQGMHTHHTLLQPSRPDDFGACGGHRHAHTHMQT